MFHFNYKDYSFWCDIGMMTPIQYIRMINMLEEYGELTQYIVCNIIREKIDCIFSGTVIYIGLLFILHDDFLLENTNKLKTRLLKKQ